MSLRRPSKPIAESAARNGNSLGAKGCGTLFFGAFLAMGLLFCGFIVREAWQGTTTRFWMKTPCTILRSDHAIDDSGDPYCFVVAYRYVAGGQEHESTAVSLSYKGTDTFRKVQRLKLRYPVGEERFCYVNPANPAEAVLIHKSPWIIFIIFFPMIFVGIGGIGIYACWASGKAKPEAEKPLSSRANVGFKVGMFFLAIFALVSGGLAIGLFGVPLVRTILAANWEETPCRVVHSQLREHDSDDGTTYSIDILYEYTWKGALYGSNAYSPFPAFGTSGRQGKLAVLKQYPVGATATCYVNPDDPTMAVLSRRMTKVYLFGLIPLAICFCCSVGFVAMRRQQASVTGRGKRDAVERTSEPRVLKGTAGPFVRLVGMLLLAGFWNGIVSIFLWQVIKGFMEGRPQWFMTLFLIPFVLVGLAFIGGVFFCVLALFNPRPKLRLTPGQVHLGETATLQWRTTGRTTRIKQFAIVLEGREEATYQVGTSTSTDKDTFHSVELVKLTDPRQIARGKVELTIPADSMHSFKASNNKIVWCLRVEGKIPRWPDVKEEFVLEVLPWG